MGVNLFLWCSCRGEFSTCPEGQNWKLFYFLVLEDTMQEISPFLTLLGCRQAVGLSHGQEESLKEVFCAVMDLRVTPGLQAASPVVFPTLFQHLKQAVVPLPHRHTARG